MSLVVKRSSDNRVFSFVKGGDIVIIDRLSAGSKGSSVESVNLMNQLASNGKRTLMFAYKDLGVDANVDEQDTDIDKYETDLEFLGCTGLEDVLQENVADCIRDFKTAAIKMWMLTGDKEETA